MTNILNKSLFEVGVEFIKRYWLLSKGQSTILVFFSVIVAIFESLGMFLIWPAIGLFVRGEDAKNSFYGRVLSN